MRVAASKKHGTKNTSGKVLASVALVAAAAGVAGLGTYGSFTSTTSASASVTAGTVKVALGQDGTTNRFSVAATGLVPGDMIQRDVTLSNTGNQDLASLSLTTSAPLTSSLLNTDATNGLQLSIDSCSTGWTEAGTAPAYTYTCSVAPSVVLASRPVVGANVALANLTATGNGKTDNLRVNLAFPTTADNTFQGLSSVINFDFTGTQRAATNR
jgi:predicted ribosomally synthesized peptide with SipW-like signal peptide